MHDAGYVSPAYRPARRGGVVAQSGSTAVDRGMTPVCSLTTGEVLLYHQPTVICTPGAADWNRTGVTSGSSGSTWNTTDSLVDAPWTYPPAAPHPANDGTPIVPHVARMQELTGALACQSIASRSVLSEV